MVLNAVDGTKIIADVSRGSGLHGDDIKRLLEGVQESVDEVFDQIDGAEEGEEGKEYRLPDKFTERKWLRDFVKKGLSEFGSIGQELEEEGVSHLSLTDRDAKMMKTGEGIKFAYNAQAVVDAKAGVIVGAEVVQEESDNFELVDMIDGVKENVGKVGEETVADGGYFSGEELKRAQKRGREVVVNATMCGRTERTEGSPGSEFDIWNFRYGGGADAWICPKGGVLKYEGDKKCVDKGFSVRVYRCQKYRECVHRWQCSENKKGRTVGLSPYHQAIVNQIEKQKQPEKKKLLKRRKTIVEPIFGMIKNVMNFRRWTVRGIDNVQAQWFLICTAINLRKMYRAWMKECIPYV